MMNNKFLEFSRQEIEDYINQVGSDETGFFGGNYIGGYYLQQHPPEFADFLYKYRGTDINNYVEIGVAAAGFTRILSEFMNINNMYLIDLFEHPAIEHAYVKNIQAIRKNIDGALYCFWGDSHSDKAMSFLDRVNIDFAVIDAGHEYDDVMKDYELLWGRGAMTIVFHDHLVCPGVAQAIHELTREEEYICDHDPSLYIIDRFESKLGITVCKNYYD